MFLSKLVLHNFRKFEDYTIPLHPKLNVLIGDNNAGKSTVLDAASVALGTFLLGISTSEAVTIGKEDPRIEHYSVGSIEDSQQHFPVSICAEGMIDGQQITWCRELNNSNGKTTAANAKGLTNISSKIAINIMNGSTATILPLVSYYGTGRLWSQKKKKKESESIMRFQRQSGYIDCLSAASNEKLMLKWFEKMTIQEAQKKAILPELKAVRQAISMCFAKITGTGDADVQFNLDTHRLDIITKEGDKQEIIPMSFLGDGYKGALGMIGDIAYRMAILNPQLLDDVLHTPGVVLIDEVDLHLHPKWQQRILGDLTEIFPNVQFIVSTHAPLVIGSVRSENVIILSPGKHSTIPLIEVYGHDTNTVLSTAQDALNRNSEVEELYDKFYHLLDLGDIEGAEKQIAIIEEIVGPDDPNLIRAHVTLEFEVM